MAGLAEVFRFDRFVDQDVSRNNAASAAARLIDRRREREDVDVYLEQRLDVHPPRSGA